VSETHHRDLVIQSTWGNVLSNASMLPVVETVTPDEYLDSLGLPEKMALAVVHGRYMDAVNSLKSAESKLDKVNAKTNLNTLVCLGFVRKTS